MQPFSVSMHFDVDNYFVVYGCVPGVHAVLQLIL